MRVLSFVLLLIFTTACASTPRRPAAIDFTGPTDSILLMSDFHFDPLFDPALLPALIQQSDASQWEAIFENSQIKSLSPYRADANFVTLKSALEAMKKADPSPRFIIVGGDFLPHKFEKRFAELAPTSSDKFKPFADETLRFLALMVQKYFPNSLIMPAVGNNDDACGDYLIQPQGPSLNAFAKTWAPAANRSSSSPSFISSVGSAGHYTELVPAIDGGQTLRAIVINGVYWSPRYLNTCGNASATPGAAELSWLEQRLEESQKAGEKVWLINHIPAGIDVATTQFKDPKYCMTKKFTMMINEEPNRKYLDLIRKYHSTIAATINGHTHYNEYRVYGEKQEAVLAITIPSIAPNHENNPGFQILTVDPATFAIHNSSVYGIDVDPSATNPVWDKLYDFNQFFQQTELSASSLSQILETEKTDDAAGKDRYSRFMNSGAKPSGFMVHNWDLYTCAMTHGTAETVSECACK